MALPLTSSAQLSTEQLKAWENAPTAVSHIGDITGHAKDAAPDYRRYCVGCHGDLGDGNGEVAQWLDPPMYPKPRDFQLGIFKCRSTPSGTLPTDDDLFDTIARGMDRSAMPQWSTFTKQERADLVAWVKHFSPRWANEKPGDPNQDSSRAGSHSRAHQGRTRRIRPRPVLEVPRRAGHGQRPFCSHSHRRSRSADCTLQLYRRLPAQVRGYGSGYLPHLHDRLGWHSHAVVRRQHQAGGGLGSWFSICGPLCISTAGKRKWRSSLI